MKRLLSFIGFGILVVVVLYSVCFVRPYQVSGDSMTPVLDDTNIVLIDTLIPRLGYLKRSDIVVYQYDGIVRIKRILGLSGEKITIKEGKLYTNEDDIVVEKYLNPNLRTCVPGSCIDLSERIYQVPESAYFVLGDNRENSRDSRGCLDALSCEEKAIYYVPKGEVIGKYIVALPSF